MKDEEFLIGVDEPWDYGIEQGDSTFNGEIVKIVSPEIVIFKSEEPKEFKGHIGQIFVLFSRYVGKTIDINRVEKKIYIYGKMLFPIATVGGFIYIGKDYEKEKSLASLENNSIYAFIGSLYKL